MSERLVFGYGATRHRDDAPPRPSGPRVPRNNAEQHESADTGQPAATPVAPSDLVEAKEARRDWAFTGLLAFTAVLYFRPQDQIPGLSGVVFAEISAIIGLAALAWSRVRRGLPLTTVTPEVVGVAALAAVILLTAPFSIWPGGAVRTFTDVFAKVLLIYILMANTLTSAARLHRFTTVVVVATGYLAVRAMIDYARGINLIENGRVHGAIGGMFQNPNDMALNMVAVLPLCVLVGIRAKSISARLATGLAGCAMIGAITASHSRGGFLGLAAVVLILGIRMARRRPAVIGAGALVLLLALPFTPSSYWHRISSITDSSRDETGSREARRILMMEAWQTFLDHPLYGVGAGQFQNYNPPERVETWRETHNVILQVAAETGVLGLLAFTFLLWRAYSAARRTRLLLRRAAGAGPPKPWQRPRASEPARVSEAEANYLDAHAAALNAAVIGWFVCALFASVAYTWTFYYLLALAAAPVEILSARLSRGRQQHATAARLAEARV